MSVSQMTDLECSICMEKYASEGSAQPRLLLCGHTFCLTCIEHIISTGGTSVNGVIDVFSTIKRECPVCRTKIHDKIISGAQLPLNFSLLSIALSNREVKSDNGANSNSNEGLMRINAMSEEKRQIIASMKHEKVRLQQEIADVNNQIHQLDQLVTAERAKYNNLSSALRDIDAKIAEIEQEHDSVQSKVINSDPFFSMGIKDVFESSSGDALNNLQVSISPQNNSNILPGNLSNKPPKPPKTDAQRTFTIQSNPFGQVSSSHLAASNDPFSSIPIPSIPRYQQSNSTNVNNVQIASSPSNFPSIWQVDGQIRSTYELGSLYLSSEEKSNDTTGSMESLDSFHAHLPRPYSLETGIGKEENKDILIAETNKPYSYIFI
jgi:hypothetical protein